MTYEPASHDAIPAVSNMEGDPCNPETTPCSVPGHDKEPASSQLVACSHPNLLAQRKKALLAFCALVLAVALVVSIATGKS